MTNTPSCYKLLTCPKGLRQLVAELGLGGTSQFPVTTAPSFLEGWDQPPAPEGGAWGWGCSGSHLWGTLGISASALWAPPGLLSSLAAAMSEGF